MHGDNDGYLRIRALRNFCSQFQMSSKTGAYDRYVMVIIHVAMRTV